MGHVHIGGIGSAITTNPTQHLHWEFHGQRVPQELGHRSDRLGQLFHWK